MGLREGGEIMEDGLSTGRGGAGRGWVFQAGWGSKAADNLRVSVVRKSCERRGLRVCSDGGCGMNGLITAPGGPATSEPSRDGILYPSGYCSFHFS